MAGAMQPTEPTQTCAPEIEKIRAAFPQFEVDSLIGHGGMGVVFKARQPQLDRVVALKILAPERTGDPRFAERFQHEAQALARLNHPNIVTIHDFGKSGAFYFLLMEFVDGLNLRQLIRDHKLEPEEALAIVPPICEALQVAHDHGIVHRDIKPENILVDKEGRVKIADFGIAKMVGPEPAIDGQAESQPAGTPQYMAPEQKENSRRADHRADIYSLGVVLYELLTGELPTQRLEPPSVSARGVKIDVRLDEVVLRAMEREPDRRYQHASEVKTIVEQITAEHAKRAPVPQTPEPAISPTPIKPERPPARKTSWGTVLGPVVLHGALLAAGMAFLWFLLSFTIPILSAMELQLPAFTRLVIHLLNLVCRYWFIVIPLVLFADLLLFLVLRLVGGSRLCRWGSAGVVVVICAGMLLTSIGIVLPFQMLANSIPQPASSPGSGYADPRKDSAESSTTALAEKSDVAEITAEGAFAEGDTNKHYFLIQAPVAAGASAAARGLLVVLPGGDAGPDFQPFVKRICKYALPPDYLVVQLVAPRWDENQAEILVWPTLKNRYPAAKFSTEEFADSVIEEVSRAHKIDPRRVFTLSWSSGGPAGYAISLENETRVRGSFVAMSVFRPAQLDLTKARGQSYYILHSPQDNIPMRMAEQARDLLAAEGARTMLETYEGGHGWHGDVFGNIRRGIVWLETNAQMPVPSSIEDPSQP
jgi:predicted esterase/predicted Ser/Thr protein kinase